MTNSTTQFIAFFGATGGCTNTCLVHTLIAGYHATALARTPSKLTDMLLAQGISQAIIDAQLTIFKGDIADVHAVKNVLTNNHDTTTVIVQIVSQIMSGVGGAPQTRWSLRRPVTIDNPEICATGTKNIVQALKEIYASHPSTAQHKPSITVISTTGISDVKEDVPFGFWFFYHVVLADPHEDRKATERLLIENSSTTMTPAMFTDAVMIRPSLLTGDQNVKGGKGWEKLKVGVEEKPAVGYTVHRADVGQWVFEQIIKTGGEGRFGQKITLTN
ncbi:hypothetical protein BGX33_001760 [Mortierella sp. NVP41]|nr:hypothetical protein BGX33_001760 [Mortierella sp. NVP41]